MTDHKDTTAVPGWAIVRNDKLVERLQKESRIELANSMGRSEETFRSYLYRQSAERVTELEKFELEAQKAGIRILELGEQVVELEKEVKRIRKHWGEVETSYIDSAAKLREELAELELACKCNRDYHDQVEEHLESQLAEARGVYKAGPGEITNGYGAVIPEKEIRDITHRWFNQGQSEISDDDKKTIAANIVPIIIRVHQLLAELKPTRSMDVEAKIGELWSAVLSSVKWEKLGQVNQIDGIEFRKRAKEILASSYSLDVEAVAKFLWEKHAKYVSDYVFKFLRFNSSDELGWALTDAIEQTKEKT